MDPASIVISFFFYTAFFLPIVATIICFVVYSIYRFFSYGPVVYHLYDEEMLTQDNKANDIACQTKEVNSDKLEKVVQIMINQNKTKISSPTTLKSCRKNSPKMFASNFDYKAVTSKSKSEFQS